MLCSATVEVPAMLLMSSLMSSLMTPPWTWVAGLLAIYVALRFSRPVLGFVLAPRIAAKALAAQPDLIHLEPAPPTAWSDPAAREKLSVEIASLGFEPVGDFKVHELPAFKLRLLVHGPESLYAIVYEHPARGTWVEFACRFADGTGSTWTTARPTGLGARPGHPVRAIVDAAPATLWQAVMRARPAKPARPASVASAVADFENAWAEAIAWRRQNGISRIEVARVGARASAGPRKAA
jgi:hypothetical protein